MPERHVKLPSGDKKMRIGLLIVAGLALIGFLVVAVVLPHMQGAEAKAAAQALIEGAEPAKHQVGIAAAKTPQAFRAAPPRGTRPPAPPPPRPLQTWVAPIPTTPPRCIA